MSHYPASGSTIPAAVSLLLGAGFTFGLFWGIAQYDRSATGPSAPPTEILPPLTFAEPPPPPPPAKAESTPDTTSQVGFEFAPSDSPVKIAVSPPSPAGLLPEDLSKAPSAAARIAPLTGKFGVKTGAMMDPRRVYQKRDVDQVPVVLDRGDMAVPGSIRGADRSLRTLLLVVINADGAVAQASVAETSGKPRFDALMLEKIKAWTFSPAIKGGKRVRCMIAQAVTVKWSASDSPFHE